MIQPERLLKYFLDYVMIDSETGHEREMSERLAADLTAMGLEIKTYDVPGYEGRSILAKVPGTTDGEPILLNAHMDTVVPGIGVQPQIRDGVIYSDGTTVLGGDDKSGICAILEAVRSLQEDGTPHRPLEIFFSVGEESGLNGAKAFDDYEAIESKVVFVCDAGGAPGSLVLSAPHSARITAVMHGKSAHAGLEPQNGINAIQVMAKGIAKMNLLRVDEATTCNIGSIHTDFPTNIVPDRCEIAAEVRGQTAEKMEAQVAHMVGCLEEAAKEAGATLECDVKKSYGGYLLTEEDPYIQMTKKAVEKVGLPWLATLGAGGSDACVLVQHGITPVVLGTGMTRVHSTQESLKVQDLIDFTRLIEELAK